jgi:hypothetical protein
MEDQSAETGNVPPAAPALSTTRGISAQGVPPPLTELRSALERRKHAALTPYNPQTWEALLSSSGLRYKYPTLPQNLRTGFLINIPPILVTQTPPNKATIAQYQTHFDKIVGLELEKQRYIGPFSRQITESLIGPFQSSPFSIIPKPGKRVVLD